MPLQAGLVCRLQVCFAFSQDSNGSVRLNFNGSSRAAALEIFQSSALVRRMTREVGQIDPMKFLRTGAYLLQERVQRLRNIGIGYEIAVVRCIIYASVKVQLPPQSPG